MAIPLLIDARDRLLLGRGYRVFRQESDGEETLVADYPVGGLRRLLVSWSFTCRIAREGIHRLYETATGEHIAVGKGAILFRAAGSSKFTAVCTAFRGSRPLYIGYSPRDGHHYFGEYFSNPDRKEVHVFGSKGGREWKIVHTFAEGDIRHVHNIVYDPYRAGLWVLTGDTDEEAGLWFTADGFRTLEQKFGGSQLYRAVDVIPTPTGLIVPSDTPLKPNFVSFLHLPDGPLEQKSQLASSAFHCFEHPGGEMIFTVGEPSSINDTRCAHLYARSGSVEKWRLLASFERDFWAGLSSYYFRYPELIPVGTTEDGVLHCVGVAIQGCGYGHLEIKLETAGAREENPKLTTTIR